MDKQNYYSSELQFIKNENIKNWTIKALNSLPDYVFQIAASSTGKYHPTYALGDGGLMRHTKAAVRIAIDLFKLHDFTDEEKDIIISALLLHDGAKSGLDNSKYTKHEHPVIVCEHLKKQDFFNDISESWLICQAIASHMGQWNKSSYSSVTLPLPTTEIQKYVHLCDYLASRKFLEFNFEANYGN
jgi:hypothetical protein